MIFQALVMEIRFQFEILKLGLKYEIFMSIFPSFIYLSFHSDVYAVSSQCVGNCTVSLTFVVSSFRKHILLVYLFSVSP
jgi:hypothetical protein